MVFVVILQEIFWGGGEFKGVFSKVVAYFGTSIKKSKFL